MAVLLKDVARDAGVALPTASVILNRRAHCWASAATVARVEESARRLGYVPNRAARALRTRRFGTVGLIVPDLQNPFFAEATRHFTEAAGKAGHDLIVEDNGGDVDRERRSLERISDRQVDGIFCFPINAVLHARLLRDHAASSRPPLVLVGSPAGRLPVDSVEVDFGIGLREAVAHLAALGHRRIAFLSALPPGQDSDNDRAARVKAELARRRFPFPPGYLIRCGFTVDDAHRACGAFLDKKRKAPPTALIALNDLTAIGALRAALDRGRLVPRDLSIVGIDDIALARFLPVPLTTLSQPLAAIAERAVAFLQRRLAQPLAKPSRAVFPTRLQIRSSTGPAPDESERSLS